MEEIIIRELIKFQQEEREIRSYLRLTLIPYLSGILRGTQEIDFKGEPLTAEEFERILICLIHIYNIDYYDSSMVDLVDASPFFPDSF